MLPLIMDLPPDSMLLVRGLQRLPDIYSIMQYRASLCHTLGASVPYAGILQLNLLCEDMIAMMMNDDIFLL